MSIRTAHRWASLALLLLMAACAAPPVPADLAPRFGEVKAHFIKGQDVNVIEVRALDAVAIRGAVLIMPGGARVPAEQINADRSPSLPQGPINGIGLNTTDTTLVGQVASAALIRLPDPPAYREQWKQAVIDVTLGDGPSRRTERLAAPPAP